jgi:hypothetical protein
VIREATPAAQDLTNHRAKTHTEEVNQEVKKKKNRTKSRACEDGMAIPNSEAHLQVHEGAPSGIGKTSALTFGSLRAGQCLSASPAVVEVVASVGPAGGAVSLRAGNRSAETRTKAGCRTFSRNTRYHGARTHHREQTFFSCKKIMA